MINGIQNSSTTAKDSQTTSGKNEVMGKDDFLNLLVTQLKYQDPLNPMDSASFTAQLAQFSSLEQLENINTNIESLIDYQTGSNNSQAISFIGKTVNAYGNAVNTNEGVADPLNFTLESNAEKVFINIYDSSQNIVQSIEQGAMNSGNNTYNWDGKDRNGNTVSNGAYSFEVFAYNGDDQLVKAVPYMETTVTGVSYQGTEAYLNSGDLLISMDSIFKIKQN